MLNKEQYYKIYNNGNYTNYIINHYKNKLKKIFINTPYNTYLCIRFPFLYPRNRFSDKHYTNWKLRNKQKEIYNKWLNYSKNNVDKYINIFGEECTFLEEKYVKSEYVMKLASFKDKFLYKFYDISKNILGFFHCLPSYSELDAMPNGWRKRFGIQFCKELKEAINKSNVKTYKKNFRILQIKEKWGKFQVYVSSYTPEVDRVIKKYEYLSQYVCIECGEDATKKTLGWISPYCEKHLPENQVWAYINPVYGWSNTEYEKYNEEIYKELE